MPNQYDSKWTPEQLNTVKKILAKHDSDTAAAGEISKALKREVTVGALDNALQRHTARSMRSYMKPAPPRPAAFWTDERVKTAVAVLSRSSTVEGALAEISKTFATPVSSDMLDKAFKRAKLGTPTSFLQRPGVSATTTADLLSRLVELIKKPIEFPELCDKLDLSPKRAQELIKRARDSGVSVHVEHNHVAIYFPEPLEKVQNTKIAPVVGERQILGVISDTHLGSKYCLREQLKDAVHYMYDQGVRNILHPGDMLDGCYHHGLYELTHTGVEDQTRDFYEVLPELPGLHYHVIGGNHDQTFTDVSGIDTPEFIANFFRKQGRNDLTAYGSRGAFLRIQGALVHLWHPRGGGAYAKSYNNQKKCESYTSIKPQILLTGHYHSFNYCEDRGIQSINCPTFQGGQSAFGKSLKGSPAIGGLLLSYALTKDGTMRDFVLQKRGYFEVEKPAHIRNAVDGQPVEIEDAVTESTSRTLRSRGSKKK